MPSSCPDYGYAYEGLCARPSDVRVEHMPRDVQNKWPAGQHNLQSGAVRIYDLHSRLDIVNEGIKEDPREVVV